MHGGGGRGRGRGRGGTGGGGLQGQPQQQQQQQQMFRAGMPPGAFMGDGGQAGMMGMGGPGPQAIGMGQVGMPFGAPPGMPGAAVAMQGMQSMGMPPIGGMGGMGGPGGMQGGPMGAGMHGFPGPPGAMGGQSIMGGLQNAIGMQGGPGGNVNAGPGGRGPGGGRGGRGGGRGIVPMPVITAGGGKDIKNDYCQHFVDTGQRPQNFLRDSHLTDRYEEYPKLKELVSMKDALVRAHTTPPYYLKSDLRTLKLSPDTFGTKFDVILVDPPWEEYARRVPHQAGLRGAAPEAWAWQDIMALEIENIADNPSFIFLWCGTAEGLEAGRHCLTKWGFRRVEDIVWIKTNKERDARGGTYMQPHNQEPYSILTHTKEHCLMGLRGSVRRALDGHYIHANCDTDVIVAEEPPNGSTEKPVELYEIIERFCMGKRRLELFGEEHNIRDGWVTVGRSLPTSNFRPDVYASHFKDEMGRVYTENTSGGRVPRNAPILIPTPPDVEEARPKSPPHTGRGGGGR